MFRLQDILFGILGVALLVLLAFHFEIAVMALVGAFGCGALYLFIGMIPARHESFWHRLFVTVFLSVVLGSLVLIVPGTLGIQNLGPGAQKVVIEIAGALPVLAACFEVVRTPGLLEGILRRLGQR